MDDVIGLMAGFCILLIIAAFGGAWWQTSKGCGQQRPWRWLGWLPASGWRLKKERLRQISSQWHGQALPLCHHQIGNNLVEEKKAGQVRHCVGMLRLLARRYLFSHKNTLCMVGKDPPHLKRRGLRHGYENRRHRAEIEGVGHE